MGDKPVAEAATYKKNTTNTRDEIPFTPSAGFEPAIPTIEWPQNYALNGKAIGIGEAHLSSLVTIGTTALTFISSF